MEIEIVEGTLLEVLQVLRNLPEFKKLNEYQYYQDKVTVKEQLMLLAKKGKQIVGCKAGYNRYADGSFYSWLGGVLPEHRNKHMAKLLADYQENWAKENGYSSIKFKTLNKHRGMLLFSLKNGFNIYNVKEKDEIENYKIELIKHLK